MHRFGLTFRTACIGALAFCLALVWAQAAPAQQATDAERKEIEAKVAEAAKKEEPPEKLQFTFATDVFSQYVWRGIALSRGSAVIQPSTTLAYRGVAFNVWGNFDTNEANPFGIKNPNRFGPRWNETDITASYSYEIFKNLTLTAGVIYYILDSNNAAFDSVEIYGGFGYKTPWFDFGFSAYREVAHLPGTFLMWYISRSFKLPWYGMSLDLWSSWSAELSDDKAAFPIPADNRGNFENRFYQGLHAGHLMATLNIPLGEHVTFSPKIMYWYALGGDSTYVLAGKGRTPGLSWDRQHNHLLGGASFTFAF